MSKIHVFNTLSGKKEEFIPLQGNVVKMYACGPTVYDLSHLGHARTFIVWDIVQRWLRFCGYAVTYVRNITDVDDKIIKRAQELEITPEKLSRQCTYDFWRDMKALNIEAPDFEPRATEFIAQMIAFAESLIEAGHAYEAGGDVYFDVASFEGYGKLGKQNLEELMVGAREQLVAQEALAHLKKNPVDFALWKSADASELGWPSPWGRGRPGWHLECSAMVKRILGETIDIHAGGEDLVFPHHENEIAQSEALHGQPMARYWLHNGFVQTNSEKMAKSLGNFKTINDLLKTFSPDTIRLFILQSHYRNPIDFTIESVQATGTGLQRLLRAAAFATLDDDIDEVDAEVPSGAAQSLAETFKQEFAEAMNNDFNTAIAISQLYQLADGITQTASVSDKHYLANTLLHYAKVLGLTMVDTRKDIDSDTGSKLIDLILTLRSEARARKDYASADLIRKTLTEIGVNVMDGPQGATWEKV